MTHDTGASTGDRLAELYGAAAALLRGDRGGAGILVAMLVAEDQLADVLLTAATAALERLESSIAAPVVERRPRSGETARDLLDLALGTGFAVPDAVHAAAWRLDAVRRDVTELFTHSITAFRPDLDDFDLVAGAVALLAALVAFAATFAQQQPQASAQHLCLAASRSHR